ncbi:MAG: ABC transporter ATP-binding protein [Alistipes sp.]|nr:ABC transporter ATP-binding protein [Candidatus Alistipes equi]
MIKARNLCKSFGSLNVLSNVDIDIEQGEIVSIVGASGAGKSTLLQCLGSLLRPTSGTVEVDSQDIYKLSEKELSAFRNRNMGFIFQMHNLLTEFTALENVMMPSLIAGENKKNVKARALELLQKLHLSERVLHMPAQLSGGECQRVSIARAMMNSPKIIFSDEPTGNLDTFNRDEVCDALFSMCRQCGSTLLMVTHDKELSARADRIIVMRDGKLFAQ